MVIIMSHFDSKDYWYNKFSDEDKKLENIKSELYLLNKRKHVVETNKQKYYQKYLSYVTNSPIGVEVEPEPIIEETEYEDDLLKRASYCIKQLRNENDTLKDSVSELKIRVNSLEESNHSLEINLRQITSKFDSEKKSRIKNDRKIKTFKNREQKLSEDIRVLKKELETGKLDYQLLNREYKRVLDIALGKIESAPSDNIFIKLMEE